MANLNHLTANVGGGMQVQLKGQTGEKRFVFVDIDFVPHVYPPHGGVILNPFPAGGKSYQGDIVEHKLDGSILILKTFTLAKAVTDSDTEILIVRDDFKHRPFVGDKLMKAPSTISTNGKAAEITKVVLAEEAGVPVYKCTITAASMGAMAKGDILVEGASAGASVKMLVQNPNGFLEQDIMFNYDESDPNVTGLKYTATPTLAGVVWREKANAIPACVDAKVNSVKYAEWFGFSFI